MIKANNALLRSTMISARDQYAVAWMLYDVYGIGLLPLGTLILGFEGLPLIWSVIAAVPVIVIDYSKDRRREQKKARPDSKLKSAIVIGLAVSLFVVVPYYLGVFLRYLFG